MFVKNEKGSVFEMKNFVSVFLMKSVLGRDIDCEDRKSVKKYCIRTAYDDMMTAGRFYGIEGKDMKCEGIMELFEQHHDCFSVELIEAVAALFGEEKLFNTKSHVTTFGLAQKVVNMTFKYFYCFFDFISQDIDFTKCDCPIDSIVLDQMERDNLLKHPRNSYVWSKLTKPQYTEIQKALDGQTAHAVEGLPPCSPRLRYDFTVW